MSPTRAVAIVFSGIVLAAGCGGGGNGPTGNNGGGGPTMAKAGGDAQSGAVGTQLPELLRVRITQGGNAVAGTAVTWTVTAGGALVNPASSTTASDGTASTAVVLPQAAGSVTVSAAASGVSGSPQVFTATAVGVGFSANVTVVNNDFNPSNALLRATGSVTFTWGTGAIGHNVTPVAPNTIPASPGLPALNSAPFSFEMVFPAQGTFVYFCAAHGSAQGGMRGTVTVSP
ncbi:MAG: cupredoxin domain-containing protein [Gemmatimonadales bacterium]